jgi:hypothetical protein
MWRRRTHQDMKTQWRRPAFRRLHAHSLEKVDSEIPAAALLLYSKPGFLQQALISGGAVDEAVFGACRPGHREEEFAIRLAHHIIDPKTPCGLSTRHVSAKSAALSAMFMPTWSM